eukprot:577906-Karenia_brevis.AAC.1
MSSEIGTVWNLCPVEAHEVPDGEDQSVVKIGVWGGNPQEEGEEEEAPEMVESEEEEEREEVWARETVL